jgi:hypothetical protein
LLPLRIVIVSHTSIRSLWGLPRLLTLILMRPLYWIKVVPFALIIHWVAPFSVLKSAYPHLRAV